MGWRKWVVIMGIVAWVGMLAVFKLHSTPLSPLYYLKTSREFMQSLFVFGDEDKAYWYFTLAEKRLVESKSLQNKHLNWLAKIQLNTAKGYFDQGNNYLKNLIDKADVNYLIQKSDRISLDLKNSGL